MRFESMACLILAVVALVPSALAQVPDPWTGNKIFEGARFSFRNGSTLESPGTGLICAQLPDDTRSTIPEAGQEFLTVEAEQVLYSGAPIRITPLDGSGGLPLVEFLSQGGGTQAGNFSGTLDVYGRIVVELRSTERLGSSRFRIEIGPGYSNAPLIVLGLDTEIWVHTFVLDPRSEFASEPRFDGLRRSEFSYHEGAAPPPPSRYSPTGRFVRMELTITPEQSRAEIAGGVVWGGVRGRVGFHQLCEITVEFLNDEAERFFVRNVGHLDTTFGAEQEIFNLFLWGNSHPLLDPHEQLNDMHVRTTVRADHDLSGYPSGERGGMLYNIFYRESEDAIGNGGKVLVPEVKNSVFGYDLVREPVGHTVRWNRVDQAVAKHDVRIARGEGVLGRYTAKYTADLRFELLRARNCLIRLGATGSKLLIVIRPRCPWQTPQELGF